MTTGFLRRASQKSGLMCAVDTSKTLFSFGQYHTIITRLSLFHINFEDRTFHSLEVFEATGRPFLFGIFTHLFIGSFYDPTYHIFIYI